MKIDRKDIYQLLPPDFKEVADRIEAAITDILNGVNVKDRYAEIGKIRNDLIEKRDMEVLNPSVSSAINRAVNELLLLELEVSRGLNNQ